MHRASSQCRQIRPQRPVSQSSSYVWISDSQVERAFRHFVRVTTRRHGSNVPGPLEAQKRLARRRLAGLSGYVVAQPDMGALFGMKKAKMPELVWEAPSVSVNPIERSQVKIKGHKKAPLKSTQLATSDLAQIVQLIRDDATPGEMLRLVGERLHSDPGPLLLRVLKHWSVKSRVLEESHVQMLANSLTQTLLVGNLEVGETKHILNLLASQDIGLVSNQKAGLYAAIWDGLSSCRVRAPEDSLLYALLGHAQQCSTDPAARKVIFSICQHCWPASALALGNGHLQRQFYHWIELVSAQDSGLPTASLISRANLVSAMQHIVDTHDEQQHAAAFSELALLLPQDDIHQPLLELLIQAIFEACPITIRSTSALNEHAPTTPEVWTNIMRQSARKSQTSFRALSFMLPKLSAAQYCRLHLLISRMDEASTIEAADDFQKQSQALSADNLDHFQHLVSTLAKYDILQMTDLMDLSTVISRHYGLDSLLEFGDALIKNVEANKLPTVPAFVLLACLSCAYRHTRDTLSEKDLTRIIWNVLKPHLGFNRALTSDTSNFAKSRYLSQSEMRSLQTTIDNAAIMAACDVSLSPRKATNHIQELNGFARIPGLELSHKTLLAYLWAAVIRPLVEKNGYTTARADFMLDQVSYKYGSKARAQLSETLRTWRREASTLAHEQRNEIALHRLKDDPATHDESSQDRNADFAISESAWVPPSIDLFDNTALIGPKSMIKARKPQAASPTGFATRNSVSKASTVRSMDLSNTQRSNITPNTTSDPSIAKQAHYDLQSIPHIEIKDTTLMEVVSKIRLTHTRTSAMSADGEFDALYSMIEPTQRHMKPTSQTPNAKIMQRDSQASIYDLQFAEPSGHLTKPRLQRRHRQTSKPQLAISQANQHVADKVISARQDEPFHIDRLTSQQKSASAKALPLSNQGKGLLLDKSLEVQSTASKKEVVPNTTSSQTIKARLNPTGKLTTKNCMALPDTQCSRLGLFQDLPEPIFRHIELDSESVPTGVMRVKRIAALPYSQPTGLQSKHGAQGGKRELRLHYKQQPRREPPGNVIHNIDEETSEAVEDDVARLLSASSARASSIRRVHGHVSSAEVRRKSSQPRTRLRAIGSAMVSRTELPGISHWMNLLDDIEVK